VLDLLLGATLVMAPVSPTKVGSADPAELIEVMNRYRVSALYASPALLRRLGHHSGFLPRLVARMMDSRLPDLSGGKQVLASLCHCDNAVTASLLAARAPAHVVGGRPYFIADKEKTDLWAFLARLAGMFGARPPTRRVPLPVRDAVVEVLEFVWRLPASPPGSRTGPRLLPGDRSGDRPAAATGLGRVDRRCARVRACHTLTGRDVSGALSAPTAVGGRPAVGCGRWR
jgi:hypothetical protein